MSLNDELKAQEVQSRKNMPKEIWDENDKKMEQLRLQGLADKCLQASDRLPEFTMPNAR